MRPRRQLLALLNQVDNDITAYLHKVKYFVIDGDNQILLGGCIEKYKKQNGYVKDEHNNRYIFVHNEGWRDHKLTSQRVLSMLLLKESVLAEVRKANTCDSAVALQASIDQIKLQIVNAMQTNTELNNMAQKKHTTFIQNRLQGYSIFSSWKNSSYFKSRAMVQLETALDHITDFEDKVLNTKKEEETPRLERRRK